MQLEIQNIEIARKLLEKAMAELDERFQSLPKDLNEITLDQVGVIMESYDFINYLRNIIVNQIKYLEKESDQKESVNFVTKMYENWFTAMNDKINGYTVSYAGNSASQTVTPGGYYEKMQQMKEFFDRKLKDNNLSETELFKIQSAINLARKKGAGRHLDNKRMGELFAPTSDALFSKLPASQKEKERSVTKSLIQTGRLYRGNTATTTSVKSLDKSNVSQAALSKEDWKKENEGLSVAMLQTALAKLSTIAELPHKKIEWLQFLQEQYKDLLAKDKKIAEQINAQIIKEEENEKNNVRILGLLSDLLDRSPLDHFTALKADSLIKYFSGPLPINIKRVYQTSIELYETYVLVEMEKLFESNISIMDKVKKLDELMSNRSEYSQEIIDKYHRYNEQLTVEIANQIIDKDRELFLGLNLESFVTHGPKDKKFLQITDLLNRVGRWTSEMILQPNINSRVLALSRMIMIAHYCYSQGDINGVLAVWAGIEASSIMRLRNTIDSLPIDIKKMWEELSIELDKSKNFKKMREVIERFDGPIVPFLGVYTSDIVHFGDAVKNANWSDVDSGIKSPKSIIKAIQKIQQFNPPRLTSDTSVIDYVMSSKNYNESEFEENTLYNLSKELEPKDSKLTSSVSSALIGKLTISHHYRVSPADTVTTVLHGDRDLLLFYDELLNGDQILSHEELNGKLRERYQNEIAEINQYNNIKELVEVTEDEWISLKEKMNNLTGASILDSSTPDNITFEQLQILNLYIKVREKVTTDEQSKKLSIERKIYERRQKGEREGKPIYVYQDSNGKDTTAPFSDYYFLVDGKLYKRDMSTSHYQSELVKRLEEYEKSEIKSNDNLQLLLVNYVTNALSEIDNYLNLTVRQSLAKSIDSEVINCIKFIVNQKYDMLIAAIDTIPDNSAIKNSLEREKVRFNNFYNKLEQKIKSPEKKYIVPIQEKPDLAKTLATTISLTRSISPAKVREKTELLIPAIAPIQTQISTPSTIPAKQFIHTLPAIYFAQLRAEIAENEMRIEKINKTLDDLNIQAEEKVDELEQDDTRLAKIAKLTEELKIYESDLADCRNILMSEQNILVSQISTIANLPVSVSLDDKQAMVIICNFNALLNEDYDQSAKQLEVFNAEILNKLQEKLTSYKVQHNQVLINAISQLSLVISYLEEKLSSGYKDTFTAFMRSYRTLSPNMELSKELADYYGELNKFINASKVTTQVKSEPEKISPAPPPPDTESTSLHISGIPEIEDWMQSQVRPESLMDEVESDSRPSSVASIASSNSEESILSAEELQEINEYRDWIKKAEESDEDLVDHEILNEYRSVQQKPLSVRDYEIWKANRVDLYRLIYNRNYWEFNDKLNQIGFSDNGKKQVIEVVFTALKNNNLNGSSPINYQDYINQNILKITNSILLASHYDFLQEYIQEVAEKNQVNSQIHFKMPDNIAVQRFIENTLESNFSIIASNMGSSLTAMKKYIATIQLSDQLTSAQKLDVCEKLFHFIRINKVTNAKNEEVDTLYTAMPDEDISLFEKYLPEERKPALVSKQIELIKLLKEAYVEIVSDAYDHRATKKEEWDAVHKLAEKREEDIKKRGLVDFQNSNTPINISETGTRKKINKFLVSQELRAADKEIYKEITNAKVGDLNKVVDKILKAQEDNDFETAAKYIHEYLGKRKYGILTRNYREDFIEIAIEKGKNVHSNKNNLLQPSSPLLRLVKNAGPELRNAITETEILDSHFWKGHNTSKKYISEALFKGNLTLEDFINYRAKFTDKKEHELKMIETRQLQLEENISEIKSEVIKNVLLSQIRHFRIDFLESDEFNDFITKFFVPMVAALNKKYQSDGYAADFNVFYHAFSRAEGVEMTAEKSMFITKRFSDNYNKAMKRHVELMNLQSLSAKLAETNLNNYPEEILQIKSNMSKTFEEVKKYAISEDDDKKKIFKAGSTELEQYHKTFNSLRDNLVLYKNGLEELKARLDKVKLTSQEKQMYANLYNVEDGVHNSLHLTDLYLQQLDQINKDQLQPLRKLYLSPGETSLVDKLSTTLTHFIKSKK